MDFSDASFSALSRCPTEPPCKTISTIKKRIVVFLATVATAALFLFFIFFSIHEDYSLHSVYLFQGCLAIGLLEESWWQYRIRHRFLAPLEASTAVVFGDGYPETLLHDHVRYDRELQERMEPKKFAVNSVTERWIKDVRGAAVTIAMVAASVVAAICTVIAMYTEDKVTMCAAVGAFAGMLGACLAPTLSDGIAIFVHEGALTVTGMNIMIVHYTGSKSQMEILDYLYVALAGWAIIVISRIIMSKRLLECFLMVALDTVALLHVTIIMMEVLDFIEHPLANYLPHELAAFFISVASAELGHYLFDTVTSQLVSGCLWHWRCSSPRLLMTSDFVMSVLFGAAGMMTWIQIGARNMGTWSIVALLVAVGLSHLGRSFMSLIHETAMAPPWNCTTFTVWNNGMMELMNPFLVGWIVFYPYIKTILEAEEGIE